jgi:hypothetical protein
MNGSDGQRGADDRVRAALGILARGVPDGEQFWVIDQVLRALTGGRIETVAGVDWEGNRFEQEAMGETGEYREFVARYEAGEDGPHTYKWEKGTPP